MKASTVARVAAAMLAGTTGSIAMADASLTLTPTSGRCVWTGGDSRGNVTSTSQACGPSSSFMITNGFSSSAWGRSYIELTYDFSYRDDGLALPVPMTLDTQDYTVLTYAAGGPPSVSFESATLSVDVTSRFGPMGPGYAISASVSGAPEGATSMADGYLMFGLNDRADSFTGSLTVTIGVTSFDVADVTRVTVNPSVAAIPEPSTYVLSLVGLAAVAFAARRRRPRADADVAAATRPTA